MANIFGYILITLAVIIGSIAIGLPILFMIFGPVGAILAGLIIYVVSSMAAAILPVVCIPWFIRSMIRKFMSENWLKNFLVSATYIWMVIALVFTVFFALAYSFCGGGHRADNIYVANFLIGSVTLVGTLFCYPVLIFRLFPHFQVDQKHSNFTASQKSWVDNRVKKDEAKMQLLRKKVLQMDERDMTTEEKVELGRIYQHADGATRDYQKAKCLYQEAIAAGDNPQAVAAAKNHLAFMYLHGRGVEVNYAEAKRLCEEVIQQNADADETEIAIKYIERLRS
jgi:hypothetical protein